MFGNHEAARRADNKWRYTLIVCLISQYDDESLQKCISGLKQWVKETVLVVTKSMNPESSDIDLAK